MKRLIAIFSIVIFASSCDFTEEPEIEEELELRGYNNLHEALENPKSVQNLRLSFINEGDLTVLPESIGLFENLAVLELENFPSMENLPEAIGDLAELKILSLRNVKLAAFPS
ncbi:MAG: hypothetical protein LPJ98_12010, partial [Cyclobacteriaceae bacterium]|nr:hypothetical protein [Cyclobacteriaceae bacterium]